MAALYPKVAFAHHAAIGKIAHPDAVRLGVLLDANIRQHEQAVARNAACFHPSHNRIASNAPKSFNRIEQQDNQPIPSALPSLRRLRLTRRKR
jgi:hypothetical protein